MSPAEREAAAPRAARPALPRREELEAAPPTGRDDLDNDAMGTDAAQPARIGRLGPRAALEAVLAATPVTSPAWSALEALATLRCRIGDRPAHATEIARALAGNRSLALHAVNALAAWDLNHPDLAPIALLAVGSPRAPAVRERHVTVRPETLPQALRDDLAALRAPGPDRFFVGPAVTLLNEIERELCGLCWAAHEKGIEPGFHDAAIDAYFRSLVQRNLRPQTILNALHRLHFFARATGRAFRQSSEIPFWTRRNSRTRKTKYDKLDRLGLTRADLLCGASEALERALSDLTPFERVDAFNQAAFFALQHEFPARRLDTSRLRLGVSALRLHAAWQFDFVISKTGEPITVTLPERVTALLDSAVLRDGDPARLDVLYRRLHGAPLLRHLDGAPVSKETLSWWFHRQFGIGPHIARTLIYDDLASERGGVVKAARLCGHVSADSAEEYLSPAGWRALSRRGHERFMQLLLAPNISPRLG
jgi:hypothetical protein